VQATSAGIAIALGGAVRDVISGLAAHGSLGPALTGPATGYGAVYQIEIVLLFATLVAIGPLVRSGPKLNPTGSADYGLALK
jgi:BCD family chlorophyll transporter-like MFS transporter